MAPKARDSCGSGIAKDARIEEIPLIFQIEDARSGSYPPVVQIEDINLAKVVLQGVSEILEDGFDDNLLFKSTKETAKNKGKVNLLFILNLGCCRNSSESVQPRGNSCNKPSLRGARSKNAKHLVKVVFAGLLTFETAP